ncbi:aldo/keto reductase-like protein [Amylocarpus encephaloides]|uniref:Aldo/keto reductase-like protein n=1 Tax=Amylocarpus encephaloides TaxID=45428 RepID=A0A9P7Y8K6_9HELO|nr:aldo/keto reductase-like protein [Amylocarpus encephaloides]
MAVNSIDTSEPSKIPAKAAHTNMMTDCIMANLPPEVLRSVMRGTLGGNPNITAHFQSLVSTYLTNSKPSSFPELFTSSDLKPLPALYDLQSRYRCLMGCGRGFESLETLSEVVRQVRNLSWKNLDDSEDLVQSLATIDGDLVQAVTAVQKQLHTTTGARLLTDQEVNVIHELENVLDDCEDQAKVELVEFPFERGKDSVATLLGRPKREELQSQVATKMPNGFISSRVQLESMTLGNAELPRMLMGLWQFSSPAWGTASRAKINLHFRKHVDAGFIAYDMADHYGDAEVTFGQFRSNQADCHKIYCATKWCVFEPTKVSKDLVDTKINERLTAINTSEVDLLQFHWQDYDDHQYVEVARMIHESPHVRNFGLCNFDTQRMNEIVDSGVNVVSNQVQFSLVDLRPTFRMAESCRKRQVKLLTYGSLCGGFLAEKWLGKITPNLFDQQMTPSHRKYLEMITVWGGWPLFQQLLQVLFIVGQKYRVSVSSVALRWVLDHDYVGAVIIGARMGISEHVEENLKVFAFRLDDEDKCLIREVLERSKVNDVFEAMGDCGAEYRQ